MLKMGFKNRSYGVCWFNRLPQLVNGGVNVQNYLNAIEDRFGYDAKPRWLFSAITVALSVLTSLFSLNFRLKAVGS